MNKIATNERGVNKMIGKNYMFCYKTGIFSTVCFLITSLICINNMVELSTFIILTLPFVIITAVSVLCFCFIEAKESGFINTDKLISVLPRNKRNFFVTKNSGKGYIRVKKAC
ncbi:MAG: hypothetical protein IJ736_01215 [Firmicutes bacterium]|nr:hypothetical protein [Bacillota bacterium]